MERITSRQNKLIVHVSKLLAQRKYRRECGEFAAEGSKLFSDAVSSGIEILCVLKSEETTVEIPDGVHAVELPAQLFGQISTQETPQGVIFTAKLPDRAEVVDGQIIILDGVQDPGNIGTVLRTAASLGYGAVLLTGGCADPFSHKVVRASMGGVFRIPAIECGAEELVAFCGSRKLLAAMPGDGASDVREVDWQNFAAVIGSEGRGISREVLALCSGTFTIPMEKETESLNAAIAAAITMWESRREVWHS